MSVKRSPRLKRKAQEKAKFEPFLISDDEDEEPNNKKQPVDASFLMSDDEDSIVAVSSDDDYAPATKKVKKEQKPRTKKTTEAVSLSPKKRGRKPKGKQPEDNDGVEACDSENLPKKSQSKAKAPRKVPVRKQIKKETVNHFEDDITENFDTNVTKQIKLEKENYVQEFAPSIKEECIYKIAEGNMVPVKKEPVNRPLKKDNTFNLDPNADIKPVWYDFELLSEQRSLRPQVARSIIKLFDEGNTVPFIARYRRDVTGNMSPEELREVKECIEEICCLRQKIQTVIKTIEKQGNLDPQIHKAVRCARSMEEVEIIYAPYKPGSKKTLAERAKQLGLEETAMNILNNTESVDLNCLVDVNKKGMSSLDEVKKGIVHIIAYTMATDSEVLSFMRELRREVNCIIETKKTITKKKSEAATASKNAKVANKNVDESKFEIYFDYKIPVKYIKPHQVLAINRGEHHKFLSVKVVVPDVVLHKFSSLCFNKWTNKGPFNPLRKDILDEAIADSYNRLVQPLIVREIRAELKTIAEKASYDVFAKNLKQILLAPPLKGQLILAIDPGYTGGCKMALVSRTGSVLDYDVIYPHRNQQDRQEAGYILKHMMNKHDCSLIALGNGTACRETEEFLTDLIQNRYFHPRDVKYTIVSEDGASVYSCSAEAKKEFPKLDTNIVSAVSLARRIQDPLAELVKVEPQHLGVGMYQHDLKKKTLEEALNDVVSECVSFVGVDLNTASQCLLRRIAGLSDKRATQIIEYREKNGQFICRKQLTEVHGIGPRIFEQCAGFLRVGPSDGKEAEYFYRNPKTTKLDCTYIHPESYNVANSILKKLNLKLEDVGKPFFIHTVKSCRLNVEDLSKELSSTPETVKLILEALSHPLNYDLRKEESHETLFKKGLNSINDMQVGTIVTGRVKNVVHFGYFVDIGVGKDALIHNSKSKRMVLNIGDRVEAKVIDIDLPRQRVALEAVMKL